MSDQHDAGSLPELTPEQESEVRRLLAEARHDEPMPADVAARLDATLADLSPDRPAPDRPDVAPVIDLAARRRRRNAAALLTGAAAVIVAGFAIGQAIDVGSGGSDDAASNSAVSADRSGSDSQDESGDFAATQDAAGSGGPADSQSTAPSPAELPVLTLRSSHLRQDITRQLAGSQTASSDVREPSAESYAALGCLPPAASAGPDTRYGLGELFPALFDGRSAVLALRPPAAGTQRAEVLACDTGQQLDSVDLSAP